MRQFPILLFLLAIGFPGKGQADPYLSGRAAMVNGDYSSAAADLTRALEIKQGDTEILYQLGICYFKINQNPEAWEAFYEVEKRRQGMASLYLARTEVRLNHPELALKYLKEHLSSKYRVPEKEILLDEELSRLEGTRGWQQLWEEKDWYTQEDLDFQEAQFLKENGRELEAINLLNRLEKQGYQSSNVHAQKADIYTRLGNTKAARSELRSAVNSDVRNLDALYQLALIQLQEGDTEDALQGLDRVIRQEPHRFEAYLARSGARSDQGNLEGALEDLDLYLTYFPDNPDAYYRKGLIQHNHGKYLDAIRSFNRALELDRGKAEYYFARGMTYVSTGTTRSAEKDLSMALDLDPFNGETWFEKGKVSEQLGNREDACFCFRKAYQYGVHEAAEVIEKRCN
jgi:tetratricopeptide (TPR) repeat protein